MSAERTPNWLRAVAQHLHPAGDTPSMAAALLEESQTRPVWVVAINAEKLIAMRRNPELLELYSRASYWYCDGVIAIAVARLLGLRPGRITGVSLGAELLRQAERSVGLVAMVGGKPGVAEEARAARIPNRTGPTIVANGYEQREAAVEEIRRAGSPTLVCAALGSPAQERLLSQLKPALRSGVLIGLGGSFDVYSGRVKLAPAFIRKIGLETVYRLAAQPSRFRRYLGLRWTPALLVDAMRFRAKSRA